MTNRPSTPVGIDIRSMVLQAVILPLLTMALVAVWLGWQVARLSNATERVDRAELTIAQAGEVQKTILDQETGLRAFLLTEQRGFLDPYWQANPDGAIDELEILVAGAPAQRAGVQSLRTKYHVWHAHAEDAIANPSRARNLDAMAMRKAEMDSIRAVVTRIVTTEEAARAQHVERVSAETRVTAVGSILVLVVLGGGLALVSRGRLRTVARTYEEALTRSAESETALAAVAQREREARERAQAALRAKDEFLSTLSHELRTPLTAILGWSSVLRGKQRSRETLERALGAIERNARVQAQIVDDLLDESRIVAGKFRLRLVSMDAAAVVRAALEVVQFSAESKGISVETEIDPPRIPMIGDPDRLQQVVWNLLSNAVKFTPRGGRISIAVTVVEERVRIEVRDTGEGITPDFLPQVFDRFRQADSSMTRAHGGLGLGLAIVKHLCDLHGGEVKAESDGSGKGSTFTVVLPRAPDGEALATPPEPSRPATDLRGVRVLVVDDDPDTLALVTTILREQGASVETAASGAAALALIERSPVDVVVSDLGMPGLDGYELLDRIRATVESPPPALALSAYAGVEDVKRAHLAGFQRHMAKPVTPEHLVEAVMGLAKATAN
jgi:signal transduction histidine kinase